MANEDWDRLLEEAEAVGKRADYVDRGVRWASRELELRARVIEQYEGEYGYLNYDPRTENK